MLSPFTITDKAKADCSPGSVWDRLTTSQIPPKGSGWGLPVVPPDGFWCPHAQLGTITAGGRPDKYRCFPDLSQECITSSSGAKNMGFQGFYCWQSIWLLSSTHKRERWHKWDFHVLVLEGHLKESLQWRTHTFLILLNSTERRTVENA